MNWINRFLRQFNFSIQEATSNIVRSGWMTWVVVTTMVSSLSIFGGFWLLLNDFKFVSTEISSQLQVIAFLKADAGLDTMITNVQVINGVKSVELVTKEMAWQELKSEMNEKLELDSIGEDNPLPDSLRVLLNSADDVDYVIGTLESFDEIEEVKYSEDLATYILEVEKLIKMIGLIVTSLLGLATLAIIINTIRLAVNNRRQEIEIMRLVGATDWFIRLPFIIEGLFFGFVSSIITSFILFIWRSFSLKQIKVLFPFVPVNDNSGIIWQAIAYIIILSMLIGFIGSAMAVHRYLRNSKLKLKA